MTFNFPISPTLGQKVTNSSSSISYEWNGTVWNSLNNPYTASGVMSASYVNITGSGILVNYGPTSIQLTSSNSPNFLNSNLTASNTTGFIRCYSPQRTVGSGTVTSFYTNNTSANTLNGILFQAGNSTTPATFTNTSGRIKSVNFSFQLNAVMALNGAFPYISTWLQQSGSGGIVNHGVCEDGVFFISSTNMRYATIGSNVIIPMLPGDVVRAYYRGQTSDGSSYTQGGPNLTGGTSGYTTVLEVTTFD
jgi:hypothetical protein